MIRFARVPEPEDFDERAKAPGTLWLAAHPDAGRPKDFWTPFKGALAHFALRLTNRSGPWIASAAMNLSRHTVGHRYCAHGSIQARAMRRHAICSIQDENGWFKLIAVQLRV